VLWLLGLPTGALILFLDRHIPESPRFLAAAGLLDEAGAVLMRFAGKAALKGGPVGDAKPRAGMSSLFNSGCGPLTFGLAACGLAWGLLNFGFLLWLPTSLGKLGIPAGAASSLLARSALLALPGTLLVIWLYHAWSSVKTLGLFIAACSLVLATFGAAALAGMRSEALMTTLIALLLVSASGVIAMLIPYAAEIYPAHLRATGSGLIAASSKAGGILGAAGGVLGLFAEPGLASLVIAAPLALSALLLARSGIETRGRMLEQIQEEMSQRGKGA
jgi:putative MFS transporter